MNQEDVNQQLAASGIVPVVKIENFEDAWPLAEALVTAGLPVAEVTLRTNCALQAIESISEADGILLGAGTVLNIDQTKAAIDAGAKFIVSPGLDEAMVRYCLDHSIPVYPGVSTATEVQKAINLGLGVVKLFPAEAVGGVKTLKALAGPFHTMKFMPTGGVNLTNLCEYLRIDCVLAVGGSWMVKPELYADGDYSNVIEATGVALKRRGTI